MSQRSVLDQYRQNLSMAQQLANKRGYASMVQYIGEEKNAQKLAKLNTLIQLGIIEEDQDIKYYKTRLIEQGKAYFMTRKANEITQLGFMLGDTKKRSSGVKRL